jgi:hypothetical protein
MDAASSSAAPASTAKGDPCALCGKVVHTVGSVTDKHRNAVWHKSCFKCASCDRQLNLGNYKALDSTEFDGKVYCESHFAELRQNMPKDKTAGYMSDQNKFKKQPSSANVKPPASAPVVLKKKGPLDDDFDDIPAGPPAKPIYDDNSSVSKAKGSLANLGYAGVGSGGGGGSGGPVTITVVEGKEMPTQLLEVQDILVEIAVGSIKKRTGVKYDAKKTAKWNDALDFGNSIPASTSDLTISVINTAEVASGGKEETLCSGTFPIKSGEQWYEVKPRGQIKLLVKGR